MITKNRRLFVRAVVLLALSVFGAIAVAPAKAGGGGVVDPDHPCAFNGYFGSFSDTQASLAAFWSSNGDTFSGAVGSSTTAPYSPSPVGGHSIFTKFVITANLGGGMFGYDVYHIVKGCGRGQDDRANHGHGDHIAAVFVDRDDAGNPDFKLYCVSPHIDIYAGEISLALLDSVPHPPATDTLIKTFTACSFPVRLYALTTGEFQLNFGPDAEGHTAIMIFSDLSLEAYYYDIALP